MPVMFDLNLFELSRSGFDPDQYNQTAADLENIKSWWTPLRPDEQGNPSNIDALVENTEKVLATELSGWTQRMQDALANLRKDQEKEADDKGADGAGRTEAGPNLVVAARNEGRANATPTPLFGAR